MDLSSENCCRNEVGFEESWLKSIKVLSQECSDCGIPKNFRVDKRFDSMNAMEILRETVRVLRFNSSSFMAIAAVLICPVSAVFLSNALVYPLLVKRLFFRFLLVAQSSGLPSTSFLKQSCLRLAEMIISSTFCYPLFVTLLLLSKTAIVYSVACTYTGKKIIAFKFYSIIAKIWRRLLSTYICISAVILGCLALFLVLLVSVCNTFVILGCPSYLILYPALAVAVVSSVAYAHTIIVCNLAIVISVLEDISGFQSLHRAVFLIKGRIQVGLLIFLGSTIGMVFVEGLFDHRVKTLSYGDGSSRIWEGPLLVIMYSFMVLLDSMMSAVFYFTCRCSSMEPTDEDDLALIESPMTLSG